MLASSDQYPAVDRIRLSGDERRLVGTEIKRQRRDFLGRGHAANRLVRLERSADLVFTTRIVFLQEPLDEWRVHARRTNAIAADAALDVVDRDRPRHREHGALRHRIRESLRNAD